MASPSTSPPPALSRYRSVRKSQQAQAGADATPSTAQATSQAEASTDDQVPRSQSRYRRNVSPNANAGANDAPASHAITEPEPQQDHIDVVQRRDSRRHTPTGNPIVLPNLQRKPSASRYHKSPPASPTAAVSGAVDGEQRRVRSGEMNWPEEDDRRRRLQERYSLNRSPSPVELPPNPIDIAPKPQPLGLFPPMRAEPVREPAPPVMLDGPPTSDQIRATRSTSALPKFMNGDGSDDDAGCFGFLKRKRGQTTPQTAETSPIARAMDINKDKRKNRETAMLGGGGVVVGIDAPVSAVNAGDREILVECGNSKTIFPVTPATTAVDIIKSAAKLMQERIDVNSAVLIEHFGTVGVQRPLRRYEHIRDVMNSWNADKENSLILVDPGTGSSEVELSISGVPRKQPDDDGWVLWYSQKPGKWDKRLLSLRSDGRMTLLKDEKKPQDLINICHLSDFDIYRPTEGRAKKKIKPPKKFCFAIKSQQKTAMFESTHDFVHFFCTPDRPTADAFYAAVQSWRSWYLVNVMGEGKKARAQPVNGFEKDLDASNVYSRTHQRGKSLEAGNAPGAAWPSLDPARLEKPVMKTQQTVPISGFTKSSRQFDTTISPERRTSTAKKPQFPPGSMSNRAQLADDEPLGNLARQDSSRQRRPSFDQTRPETEQFAANGLLGRNYSQRQKESNERETTAHRRRPSTSGPVLTNQDDAVGGVVRRHSTRAGQGQARKTSGGAPGTADEAGLQRSTSTRAREMPKPLVDLTPTYREPPQHVKKGRAFNPDSVGPGGLIDSATTPDDPLGIPSSHDWRAGRNRETTGGAGLTRSGANAISTRSRAQPKAVRETAPASAFTGEGLLAGDRGQQGWGGGMMGRGVMDGSKAKGPLLDLSDESMFAQGSLLNRVERDQGPAAPIIDRSREYD